MLSHSERPVRDLHRLRQYTFWSILSCGPLALFCTASVLAGSNLRGLALAVAAVAATAVTALGSAALTVFMRGGSRRMQRLLCQAGFGALALGLGVEVVVGEINGAWMGPSALLVSCWVLWAKPGTRAKRLLYSTGAVLGFAVVLVQSGLADPILIAIGMIIFPSALIGVIGQWWNYTVAFELEHSRGLAAELAVAEERLRFAAELHDIQGGHLQAIVLKSQLARRLVEARPADAVRELEAIEELSRAALRDTRAVVGGYRQVSLADEIASAARILSSAGIRTEVDADVPELNPEHQRLLGLLVREGTTNLLRHAEATEAALCAKVADGSASIAIDNDGDDGDGGGDGNGLTMLAERFATAGGLVEHARAGGRFVLTGSLPLETDT